MKKQDKQALRELSLTKLKEKLIEAQKKLVSARLAKTAGKHSGKPVSLLADEVAVIKTIIWEKEVTKK